MSEISKIVNKGVPISTPITILYNDLLKLSGNKKVLTNNIEKAFDEYLKFLNDITDIGSIQIFKTLGVYSSDEDLEKKVYFSPSGYISSLVYNLNAYNAATNPNLDISSKFGNIEDTMKSISPELEDRIKKLRLITNEKNLKRKYPFLYSNYEVVANYYHELLKIKKDIEKLPPFQKLIAESKLKQFYRMNGEEVDLDELFQKASTFNIKGYCNNIADSFEKLLNHTDEIVDYLFTHSINCDDLNIDKEKLELYIANQYMQSAELLTDVKEKQRFVYYINTYFTENPERKIKNEPQIEIGEVENELLPKNSPVKKKGQIITPTELYKRFRKLLVENPELKLIDLSNIDFNGMNIQEVENLVLKYLNDISVNWDIVPESEDFESTIIEEIRKSTKKLTEEEKNMKRERMLELYMQKKEFFSKTKPIIRVKGKETFDGYIGYIYKNGKVVLEKYYKSAKRHQVSDGDAIYIMNISDFYRLSHFTKKELMHDERVERIVHSGNWQEKLQEKINVETHEYSDDVIKQLIKDNNIE